MKLSSLTIAEFQKGLRSGEFSAREAAESAYSIITERDEELGAYLHLLKDEALSSAEGIDAAVARGDELPPLSGVPLAIKDTILMEGVPTTAGSLALREYKGSYDASVITRLREERAVFLGKTNLDEFAMGSSTEHSAYYPARHPLNTAYVPGGSSGGSAVAVMSGEALAALGSDTGGSVRQPAAFCGVVGLRPTYGAVSRHGLIAMASSMDVIGPIGRTVEDVSILFDAIRGKDVFDATSVNVKGDMLPLEETRRMTVGMPREYFTEGLHEEVRRGVDMARETFEKLGMRIVEVSLPHTRHAIACYYIVMPAEASSNLARYDGMRYGSRAAERTLQKAYVEAREAGFGEEVKRRITLGTFVLSSGYYDAYYLEAGRVRQLIAHDFEEVFKSVDVLLTPTTPTPPFKLGEKTKDPLALYLEDVFTVPASLAGLPALSVPVKDYRTKDGFPVGFQLTGRRGRDGDVLGAGYAYEKSY